MKNFSNLFFIFLKCVCLGGFVFRFLYVGYAEVLRYAV